MKWKNPVQLLLGLFDTQAVRDRQSDRLELGNAISATTAALFEATVLESMVQPSKILQAALADDQVAYEYPPRLRKSWRLIRRAGRWVCQVPPVFRQAPLDIQSELGIWIRCALHPSPGSRAKKKLAQARLFAWLTPQVPERLPKAEPKGETWDLRELFDHLNRSYFDGALQAVVRWSPKVGGLSTHRRIEAHGLSHHVLTISRAYDGSGVPRVAVEGVLYHEMCHIAYPPRSPPSGHRRHIHHKEFREAERRYSGFAAWRTWERTHLHRELKILRKRLKSS